MSINDGSDIQLPEKAKLEMQELLDNFKASALEELKKGLNEIYTDIGIHADTDSWVNFREQLRTALAYDRSWGEQDRYWAADVRKKIFQENKEELVGLLDQDLVKKVNELEADIRRMIADRRYI